MQQSVPYSRREVLGMAAIGGVLAALPINSARSLAAGGFAKPDAQWLRQLGPARFAILRRAATERPFSSPLNDEHRAGTFLCAGCVLPLFSSSAKFDSGTGWPSFFAPLTGAVTTRADHSIAMDRTEVRCRRCAGHLGHVFPDGPRPTGLRYCMNGLALQFEPGRGAA
jgi:peptide-methionine (R)-S-oxide reductase